MILPELSQETEWFWTSGADGSLRFQRCEACSRYHHPPGPICRFCHADALVITPVSGRATVEAVTINYQAWHPDYPPPFVVAIVSIEEDPAVRLTTNVIGCAPEDVHIGMPVQVHFEHHDDVWLPLFTRRTE